MAAFVTSHTRLVALVAMLAAAAAAGGIFVLTRSPDSSASSAVPTSHAQALRTAPKPARAGRASKGPAPRRATERTAARRTAPVRKPAVAANGLPAVIVDALRRHRVVVVSLYASDGVVDRLARREAAAGARQAGAGFVGVNALDRRRSEPLALETGVVEAPSTLLFRRPGTLALRLDGFADRVAVAQAAVSAGA